MPKLSDLFLTAKELKKITGTNVPREQVEELHRQGYNPFIQPKTGCPVLYRDVVMQKQLANNDESGFVMDLGAING